MKVSAKQYAKTLYDLTQDKQELEIDDIIGKFVAYMKKNGDLIKSKDVVNQFEGIYNSQNNIVEATVTSVRELNAIEKEKIQLFIKSKYNAQSVIINDRIDKNIKGGIIIKIEDEILDGSVNGKLKRLKLGLK